MTWRDAETGVHRRRVSSVWHGRYPETKSVPVSVSCMHCIDPDCVKACPVGAIVKGEADGIVEVDMDKCTGCRACFESCPFGAPQFGVDGRMQKCDMCREETRQNGLPPCARTCPTKALEMRTMEPEEKSLQERNIKRLLSELHDRTGRKNR
jgi:anaerobic dimethyl sulfoxide reductase subunit B (iron-sulfur subunit)